MIKHWRLSKVETKLLKEINGVLSSFTKYWEEETLLKNKVVEDLRNYNPALLSSLLANELIKSTYSVDVSGNLIFRLDDFISMLRYKSYWKNSYTRYSNEIGLTGEGKFIKYNTDVVIDFPHKDCVLEGGMSSEEKDKKEIYYHKVLAKEEIDLLTAPKVLNNVKKIDSNGDSRVEDFFETDNLIVKGNNLIALHSIKKRFSGKVKLIYIDPPYNTGNDGFRYNDQFNHSTWLTFMKNRLEIAKDLLSEKGAIYISIDDNEAAYLKVLMDELFGRRNFLAQIAYERSGVSGLGQGGSFLVNTHESILVYAKDRNTHKIYNDRGLVGLEKKDMTRYNKYLKNSGSRKEVARFIAPATKEEVIIYQHEDYDIETISLRNFEEREEEINQIYVENFNEIFRNTSVQKENEFQNKILNMCGDGLFSADYKVSRGKNKGEWITAYYLNQQVFAWLKDTALVEENQIYKTNKLSQFWTHGSIPKADLANEGGVDLRRGKKPENLLKRIIDLETKEGDVVLDFFLGSGTTCAVAHKMGRNFIGIEQMDYVEGTALKRLKNVIDGEQSGVSKQVDWKGGGSFVYGELYSLNQLFVNSIQKAGNDTELESVINNMKKLAFFDYRVNLSRLTNEDEEFRALSLGEKKQALIESLDANQMYLSYSEIDDAQYDISESVKRFNHSFYIRNNDGGEGV